MFDLKPYLVPIAIFKPVRSYSPYGMYEIDRYAGVAFYVDDNARIATCGHIVDSVAPGEALFAMDMRDNTFHPIHDLRRHLKYDFATGIVPRANQARFDMLLEPIWAGHDVEAYGFISQGRNGRDVKVAHRLFKGHVVSTSENPVTSDSKSRIEVSFPSHKGFSGTPLICSSTRRIVGMLYSNSESSIETYRYEERSEDGKEFAESIHRIVELGLAHSTADITSFLRDLT